MRTVLLCSARSVMALTARSTSESATAMCRLNSSPSSVRCTPFLLRSNSVTPSSFSRLEMEVESAGCVMNSSFAARLK